MPPTAENEITLSDCKAYLRLLSEHVEESKQPLGPYLLLCKNTLIGSGFWRGFGSVSMFPVHAFRFVVPPSDEEALLNDWQAVGHDLYASILQYARTDYLHGRRHTESDSESDSTWTISVPVR